MEILHSHVPVEFYEVDLVTDQPQCYAFVAAALCQGYRLAKDGAANHVDALVGPKHIQDFKRAKSSQLHRQITFRFNGVTFLFDNVFINANGFINLLARDDGLFQKQKNHPHFHKWMALLIRHCANRSLLARSPDSHRRTLVVPVCHGYGVSLVKGLAQDFEDGFS